MRCSLAETGWCSGSMLKDSVLTKINFTIRPYQLCIELEQRLRTSGGGRSFVIFLRDWIKVQHGLGCIIASNAGEFRFAGKCRTYFAQHRQAMNNQIQKCLPYLLNFKILLRLSLFQFHSYRQSDLLH